ncbi:MAG: HVO_0416 family zinc finger protein [Halobacteriota archaeon]
MASAPGNDDLFDQFLAERGHETEPVRWDRSYNKLQCPDCGALHATSATECGVCGWRPDP